MNKKKIGLVALALALCITLVSAALLEYYGRITTEVTVDQAILLDGKEEQYDVLHTITGAGGECYGYTHYLQSQTSVPIDLQFNTLGLVSGITAQFYKLPTTTTLVLENKDASWQPITGDGIQAILTFETASPTFNFNLEVTGLDVSTEYALIYYADKPNRFVNWGGDNPGALIHTFLTDGNGGYFITDSVNLDMNLPTSPDKNIDEYDYSKEPDYYEHAHGAKIWIVLSTDYDSNDENKLVGWQPTEYLFETDVVVYFDTDVELMNYSLEGWGYNEITTPYTLPANERLDFIVCYCFNSSIVGITEPYPITTTIKPVS